MNEDKNNVNTRSLDDLSNLDNTTTKKDDSDFFDNANNELTEESFFDDDVINFDEEDKNKDVDSISDDNEATDDDIFAGLNLEEDEDKEDNKLKSSEDKDLLANKDADTKDSLTNDKTKKKRTLTKKQKIIIISVTGVIVLLIICLIVYLILPKTKEEPTPEPKETIVIDKGNYRYEDGTLVFLNDQKTEIGTYECQEKDENKCYVSYTSNDLDDVNVTKNIYEDNTNVQFRSEVFHNRFVFVNDGDKDTIKLYDILENKVVGNYKKIKYYESLGNDYVVLENEEDKFGVVRITSNDLETIINFTYDNLTSLEKKDNTLVAQKGSKYYLINLSDKALTKIISKPIYDYDDKHLVVKNGNTYNLVDYDNNEIYTDYNYISIINSEYVGLVTDGSLYIRDYDKNKYNEVGYNLANESYSGLNTYTKEGVLKASTYAYKVNVNNNTLTIFLKNNNDVEEKGLSLLDGKASLKQKYYSSFDGILYFYSDEEKTNLLGSYVCTNKDNINEAEEIRMCAVAHNYSFSENFKNNDAGASSKFIPIVDNRYVFITDDINYLDGEVKVYDLYKKQVLATYKHVSSLQDSEDITFVNAIDNIIVKNKSDKFGVINVNNNGITKTYDFVYDRMERIASYIEVAKNNKYQILFNNDSSSITLDSKIYDFSGKYFVIKNNDKFDIYSDDGSDNPKKTTNKSYKVIKLVGESLYIAVDDDNMVYLSTYNNTIINNEEIKLETTGDIFKIYNMLSVSINGNTAILNITKEDGTKVSYTYSIPKNDGSLDVKPNPSINGDDNETQE